MQSLLGTLLRPLFGADAIFGGRGINSVTDVPSRQERPSVGVARWYPSVPLSVILGSPMASSIDKEALSAPERGDSFECRTMRF